MTDLRLGRLERIELRDIWLSEAMGFTPWLARAENITMLGEALGINLEVEAQEKSVGAFRADILCKDTDNDKWVLIENQLERTDHNHLGQLLTYASGLKAVTVVWIAAKFTEEHRSTLDWLNRITDESFRFFGLEVELWKIGDSPAAPKFNVVAKPNDWTQLVANAARAINDAPLSETRILQRDYWAALNKVLDEQKGPVTGNKKPQAQSWMAYPIRRAGIFLGASTNGTKKWVRAELYLTGVLAKSRFAELKMQSADIERELTYSLDWEDLPDGKDCRIAIYLSDADPSEQVEWPRQHQWLAQRLNELHRVFAPRVAALPRRYET
jgi:hypothetical protein